MLLTCIKKELLSNILSLRYGLTFVLFVALTFSATAVRTHLFRVQTMQYQEAAQEQRRAMELPTEFWSSAQLGYAVEKKPNPLSIVASGLENELTRSQIFGSEALITLGFRKLASPAFQYVMRFDIVLVINLVCSLLALLLTYDAVCGEREQGTLRLMLGGPLPRDAVITSKIAAGMVTLFVPLLLSWTLSLVYMVFVGNVQFDSRELAALAWIAFFSVCFTLVFFSLGVAVSCWTQRSSTSLIVCLFCWVVLVLAIPNLVPMAVRYFVPIPPESKIAMEKQAIAGDINRELVPQWREELGDPSKVTEWSQLNEEVNRRWQEEARRREDRIDQFYGERVARQVTAHEQVSRISPAAAFTYAACHLAGTGVKDLLNYRKTVESYQKELQGIVQKREEAMQAYGREHGWGKLHETDEGKKLSAPVRMQDLPDFKAPVLSLAQAVNDSWLDLALLLGGTVLLFLLAVVGFLRYDVK